MTYSIIYIKHPHWPLPPVYEEAFRYGDVHAPETLLKSSGVVFLVEQ